MRLIVRDKPCTFSRLIICNHPSSYFALVVCLIFCLIFFYFLVALMRKSDIKLRSNLSAACSFSFLGVLCFLGQYFIQTLFYSAYLFMDYSAFYKQFNFLVIWKIIGQFIFLVQVCKILYIYQAPLGKLIYFSCKVIQDLLIAYQFFHLVIVFLDFSVAPKFKEFLFKRIYNKLQIPAFCFTNSMGILVLSICFIFSNIMHYFPNNIVFYIKLLMFLFSFQTFFDLSSATFLPTVVFLRLEYKNPYKFLWLHHGLQVFHLYLENLEILIIMVILSKSYKTDEDETRSSNISDTILDTITPPI